MKMSWNAKMVLQMVNVEPDEASDWLIDLAEFYIESYYYLDRAADALYREIHPDFFYR